MTQHNGDSLFNQFTQFALSNISSKSRALATLPTATFLTIPDAKRDVAWLGHAIERAPAYMVDDEVMDAVQKFVRESFAQSEEVADIVGHHPELYTPPVPLMWLEWKSTINTGFKEGFLLEPLSDGKPGVRATYFVMGSSKGFVPQSNNTIYSLVISATPAHMHEVTVLHQFKPMQWIKRDNEGGVPVTKLAFINNGRLLTSLLMMIDSNKSLLQVAESSADEIKQVITQNKPHGKHTERKPDIISFDPSKVLSGLAVVNNPGDVHRTLMEQISSGTWLPKAGQASTTETNRMSPPLVRAEQRATNDLHSLSLNRVLKRFAKVNLYKTAMQDFVKKRGIDLVNIYGSTNTMYPYADEIGNPKTGDFSPEFLAQMDKIIEQTYADIRRAVPYQFSNRTILPLKGEVLKDSVLPHPVTWIDYSLRDANDLVAGALLREQGPHEILVMLFLNYANPGFDPSANLRSGITEQDVADMAKDMPTLYKKLNALGNYAEPLTIIPMTYDRRDHTIGPRNDTEILPIFLEWGLENNLGYPLVANYRHDINKLTDVGLDQQIKHYSQVASSALYLANAVATRDPRIKVGTATKPKPSDDLVTIKAGQAPKRKAALVELAPGFVPDSGPATPDLLANMIAPAASSTDSAAAPTQDQPLSNAPATFLNEIFERMAKIRLMKKLEPDTLIYSSDGSFKAGEDIAGMERQLVSTETTLRHATPYKVHSQVTVSQFGSLQTPGGIKLPSSRTWLDNCALISGIANVGSLLVEKNDKIHITLFYELFPSRANQTTAQEPALSAEEQLVSSKLEALGMHKGRLFILPDIIFDRATGTLSRREEDSIRLAYYEAAGAQLGGWTTCRP